MSIDLMVTDLASSWSEVNSDVEKGSVSGTPLCLVLINYLPEIVKSSYFTCDDELKLWRINREPGRNRGRT